MAKSGAGDGVFSQLPSGERPLPLSQSFVSALIPLGLTPTGPASFASLGFQGCGKSHLCTNPESPGLAILSLQMPSGLRTTQCANPSWRPLPCYSGVRICGSLRAMLWLQVTVIPRWRGDEVVKDARPEAIKKALADFYIKWCLRTNYFFIKAPSLHQRLCHVMGLTHATDPGASQNMPCECEQLHFLGKLGPTYLLMPPSRGVRNENRGVRSFKLCWLTPCEVDNQPRALSPWPSRVSSWYVPVQTFSDSKRVALKITGQSGLWFLIWNPVNMKVKNVTGLDRWWQQERNS